MKACFAALAASLAACSATGGGKLCTAGATQACSGTAGCSGVQTCSEDGTAWGGCACLDAGGCTPGESQGCQGPAGCPGLQTCAYDGTGWSGCSCTTLCQPNDTAACIEGDAGCQGTETCTADGTSWGACVCQQSTLCSPFAEQSCAIGPPCFQVCAADGSAWGSCSCVCTPGAASSCTGANGCAGTQLCTSGGTGWGTCSCDETNCQPDSTQSCTGAGGCAGTRSCPASGVKWGACQCNGGDVGALDFSWTLGAAGACEPAGVAYVELSAADAGALFPCRAADATQTGALAGVPAGATAYQAAGEAAAQTAVYQAQGSATVQAGGSAPVSATLAAVPGALGASQLTFQWTFGGQSCATAGVSQVTLTVSAPGDPSAPDQAVLPCTDGAGADGTAVAGLAAGSYPFVVAATGASATYHGSGTVHVDGLPADALAVDVPLASEASATGSLAITWTLGAPCADGGVDHVHVFLVDPQGAIASDATGATTEQTLACGDAAGAVYGTLLPGGYFVDVQGLGGGAVISQSLGTQVAVLAGGDVTLSVAGAPLP